MPSKSQTLQNPIIWFLVSLAILWAAPLFLPTFYVYLITEILIVSLFAVSTNVLLGFTGLLSFGQVAFFGSSAYAVSLLIKGTSLPFAASFFISVGLSALAALIIGLFCMRLRAFYFAILTLAFSQIFFVVAYKWTSLTGGDDGIVGIPKKPFLLMDINGPDAYYHFVLLVVLVSLAILYLIIKSPLGEVLQAIRDNSERTEFLGLQVRNYRLASFVIAGTFGGVAGALFAPFQGIVTPELLHWSHSAEPLMISLLGGMYFFFGPIAGAVIFVFIKEWITGFTEYWMFWYGLLLMLLIMYLPGGIMGFVSEHLKRGKDDSR